MLTTGRVKARSTTLNAAGLSTVGIDYDTMAVRVFPLKILATLITGGSYDRVLKSCRTPTIKMIPEKMYRVRS